VGVGGCGGGVLGFFCGVGGGVGGGFSPEVQTTWGIGVCCYWRGGWGGGG